MTDKSKVLIVDDEPINIKLLDANLTPRGYEVITAIDGKQALEKIEAEKPDLVLLDVMMPEMDGFEVTRRIRANNDTKLMPVVLITALRETDDRVRGIEAGCDDFISKPFDQNEVLARVMTLLKLNYYRAQLDEKEKFEYVLNKIEDGIIVLDNDRNVVRCNEWARDHLAFSVGDNFAKLVNKLSSVFTVHYDGDLSIDIPTTSLSFGIERPETETTNPIFYDVHTEIITNPAGELASIVMMFNDVTEQRSSERLKQTFLGLISHKLRTPVTVVSQYSDMIGKGNYGELNEKQQKAIDAVRGKSNSLRLW